MNRKQKIKYLYVIILGMLYPFKSSIAQINYSHLHSIGKDTVQSDSSDIIQPSPFRNFIVTPVQKKPVSLKSIRFDQQKLPLFCRFEHQIREEIQIPIKFRLGNVDYVDRMEGKLKFN